MARLSFATRRRQAGRHPKAPSFRPQGGNRDRACIIYKHMDPIALPDAKAAFLVVDDEPLARMDLADLVRGCGFAVAEAGNTADALALLDAGADGFCGLITDINMPGNRSGIVLANHVRYVWPHINVIVVSAARTPIGGELPEHVRFLAKPIRAEDLMAAIAAFAEPGDASVLSAEPGSTAPQSPQ